MKTKTIEVVILRPHARKTSGTQGIKAVVALYRVNDILELPLM